MKGFIIDCQTDSGPDYIFRQVVVIVDTDDNAAKKKFIDAIGYPEGEKYLSKGLVNMAKHIILDDPEEYFTGAGWEYSFNPVKKYNQAPSNNPSCEIFFIPLEGAEIIDVIFEIDNTVTELNDYIQVNLGVPPFYNANDIVAKVDLEDSGVDFFIDRISPLTILKTMVKKGIIQR